MMSFFVIVSLSVLLKDNDIYGNFCPKPINGNSDATSIYSKKNIKMMKMNGPNEPAFIHYDYFRDYR